MAGFGILIGKCTKFFFGTKRLQRIERKEFWKILVVLKYGSLFGNEPASDNTEGCNIVLAFGWT